MSDRVAWLAENSAEDDLMYSSGRLRGYIDLDPGVGEQIHDASIEDALAWGRGRAPVVLIRLWDGDHFSAGERNPDPACYQEWPTEGIPVQPRRPRSVSALDNTEADSPVLWEVRLSADPAVDQSVFRSFVEADPRTLPVPAEHRDDAVEEIRVLVRASTKAQACVIADELQGPQTRRQIQGLGCARAIAPAVVGGGAAHRSTRASPTRRFLFGATGGASPPVEDLDSQTDW